MLTMSIKFLIIFFTISTRAGARFLLPGMKIKLQNPDYGKRLDILCYRGEPYRFTSLLKTVELVVTVPDENFYYYEGPDDLSVEKQFKEQSWFSFSPWKLSSFRLNIFNTSCIGIETVESFYAELKVRHVDLWRVLALTLGVALFIAAPILAKNFVFHYMAGVSVGIFGSLLVLVYIISRLIPKKTGALTVMFGGGGLALYALQYIWNNCFHFIKQYQSVAIGYVTIAAVISFSLVYFHGPITNYRSLKLVQWCLQLVASLCIFFSSQCREFTLLIVIVLVTYQAVPDSVKERAVNLWYFYFPRKIRLLSMDEYEKQGRVETKKALEELRSYCSSPDCNAWKTMSRLYSPQRFADFVEGSFHVTEDEVSAYDESSFGISKNYDHDDLVRDTSSDDDDTDTRATCNGSALLLNKSISVYRAKRSSGPFSPESYSNRSFRRFSPDSSSNRVRSPPGISPSRLKSSSIPIRKSPARNTRKSPSRNGAIVPSAAVILSPKFSAMTLPPPVDQTSDMTRRKSEIGERSPSIKSRHRSGRR